MLSSQYKTGQSVIAIRVYSNALYI